MSNNIMLFLVHFFVGVLLITNTVSALDFSSHQTTTTVDQVLERLSQLEARQVADTARIDLLESKLAEATKNNSIFVDTAASCTCNDFPNGTITIGSPATGTVNGINVVQLSKQVDQLTSGLTRLENDVIYKSKGDQTIDGTLSVEKISVGTDWTLEMNAGGGLDATSIGAKKETIDLSTAVTTSGDQTITGTLTVNDVQANGVCLSTAVTTGMDAQWCDCEKVDRSATPHPCPVVQVLPVVQVDSQCFLQTCTTGKFMVEIEKTVLPSYGVQTQQCCRPCFGQQYHISKQKTKVQTATKKTTTKKTTTKKNLRIQSAAEETTDCTCDTFSGDITVGDSGTGTVNGIDIVQLSTQMNQLSSDLTHLKNDVIYKSKGDQTIDGTLNVEKITIGNDWTLEMNAGGGLDATSSGAKKETIDLSTAVTTDMDAQWCDCEIVESLILSAGQGFMALCGIHNKVVQFNCPEGKTMTSWETDMTVSPVTPGQYSSFETCAGTAGASGIKCCSPCFGQQSGNTDHISKQKTKVQTATKKNVLQ